MKNLLLNYLIGTLEDKKPALVPTKKGIDVVRYWETECATMPIYQYV